MIDEAIILAAGSGRRMGLPYPKCLVKINGKSLLEYQLELLRAIPIVTLVTGYQVSFVTEALQTYPSLITRNVRLIHNSHFSTTSNVNSLALVHTQIKRPTLILMADLMIRPTSYANFIKKCESEPVLIAITQNSTQDAISVRRDKQQNVSQITRVIKTGFEWVGMVFVQDLWVDTTKSFVYQLIEPILPCKSAIIDSREIDTPEDLAKVKKFSQINATTVYRL